jgi:hypothetical protein
MAGQDRRSQSTELPGRYTTQKEVQQWFSCIVQTTPKDDLDPEQTQLTLARIPCDGLSLREVAEYGDRIARNLIAIGFEPKLAKAVSREARARVQVAKEVVYEEARKA